MAGQRCEQWRRQAALAADRVLALRLEQQGLDEERFLYLLGSPAPRLVSQPDWLRQLETAYRCQDSTSSMPIASAAELPEAIFLDFLRPLLDQAWRRLLERFATLANRYQPAAFDFAHLATLWARPLPDQLLSMVTRTLLLELDIRRLEESLVGATPEERCASFLAILRDAGGALEVLATYPVLGRALALRVEQFVTVGEVFAERLLNDLPVLAVTFGGALGELVDLEAGLGDRHDGGHTVVRLRFAAGIEVLYKPRSLAIDVVFQELLAWLGEQGIGPRFRTLRVVDRGPYGWVEAVVQTPCRNRAEIERFYARQGALLALLYALAATDFHHENLIAAGEHPVLIDLEALFQPILAALSAAREDVRQVVTNVDREVVRPMGQHLSSFDGEDISWRTMSETLLDSFARAYRRLFELRPRFLEEGGWLDRFAGLETHVILRPADTYARLVHASYHPDNLQDALHRERLFDELWLEAERFPHLAEVIPFERRDLWQGDFPKFISRTDSCELYNSSGVCLVERLPESGIDRACRRMAGLCEEDLERQLALVRLALATTQPLAEGRSVPSELPQQQAHAATGHATVRPKEPGRASTSGATGRRASA